MIVSGWLWRAINPAYWYPAGFAAGYVLLTFAATPTPLLGLWRPLIVAVLGTVVLQIILALALRDARRASLLMSLGVLALTAVWLLAAAAMVIGVWWFAVTNLRGRRRTEPAVASSQQLSAGLRVVAAVFAVAAALPAVEAGLVSADLHPPDRASGDADGPEMVILVLDGYPRSDVLLTDFGYDNAWFEAELEHRGFKVATENRSNYTATWATLASMFHMRYLEDIPELAPLPSRRTEQYQRLMRAINEGDGIEMLRTLGYRIAHVPIAFASTALITADDYYDDGHMTTLELSLIQHSAVRPLLRGFVADWILDQQRGRLHHGLDVLAKPVDDDEARRFTIIHLLSPHAPVLFDADGAPAPAPSCFPDCPLWAYHDAEQEMELVGQLHHLNGLVLDALDHRIAEDPNVVILMMSDHGTRRAGAPPERALQNFFAARTPGRADVFASDTSPVNVLPQLLTAYTDALLTTEPYRAWISQPDEPLSLSPLTE